MKVFGRRRGFSKVKDDGLLEEDVDEGLFLGEDDTTNSMTGSGSFSARAERNRSFGLEDQRKQEIERFKEGIGPRSASTSDLSTRKKVVKKPSSNTPLRLRSGTQIGSLSQEVGLPDRRERSRTQSDHLLFDPFEPTPQPASAYNPFLDNGLEYDGSAGHIDFTADITNLRLRKSNDQEEVQGENDDETACLSPAGSQETAVRKKRGKTKSLKERGEEIYEPELEREAVTPKRKKSFSFSIKKKDTSRKQSFDPQPPPLMMRSAEFQIPAQHQNWTTEEEGEENINDEGMEGAVFEKKNRTRQILSTFSPRARRRDDI